MPSAEARRHLRDPYLLAYLRGGLREALQTIAFSLNRRKLLSAAGSGLVATGSKETLQAVKNPLELALLSQCSLTQSVYGDAAEFRICDRRRKTMPSPCASRDWSRMMRS